MGLTSSVPLHVHVQCSTSYTTGGSRALFDVKTSKSKASIGRGRAFLLVIYLFTTVYVTCKTVKVILQRNGSTVPKLQHTFTPPPHTHTHTHRCSTVQLLGDLLYKISGLSGKMSTESEEDDNFGTEEARQTLLQLLGKERRDRVLAGLYMGRWVCSWL